MTGTEAAYRNTNLEAVAGKTQLSRQLCKCKAVRLRRTVDCWVKRGRVFAHCRKLTPEVFVSKYVNPIHKVLFL